MNHFKSNLYKIVLLPVTLSVTYLFSCAPVEKGSSAFEDLFIARAILCELNGCEDVDLGEPQPTIIAGTIHTCFLNRQGNVKCWGNGGSGRLGLGFEQIIGDDEPVSSVGFVPLPAQAVRLAGDSSHTCALLRSGELYCWGDGISGRLGYGNEFHVGDNETPFAAGPVPLFNAVKDVDAGFDHTCAIFLDGRVICWGNGGAGKLGYGNTENLLSASHGNTISGIEEVRTLTTGTHTCTLNTAGSVRCWGGGFAGKLGYANTDTIGDDELPESVGFLNLVGPVSSISGGRQHSCVVYTDQTAGCWGNGVKGRLGYGNTNSIGDDENPSVAGVVSVGSPVLQVSAGFEHSCAVTTTGGVVCWGEGGNGRLGYGNTNDIGDDELPSAAGTVSLPSPAVQVSAGGLHTCALLNTDEVYCWGEAGSGQTGYGNTNDIGDDEPASAGGPVVF